MMFDLNRQNKVYKINNQENPQVELAGKRCTDKIPSFFFLISLLPNFDTHSGISHVPAHLTRL